MASGKGVMSSPQHRRRAVRSLTHGTSFDILALSAAQTRAHIGARLLDHSKATAGGGRTVIAMIAPRGARRKQI